MIPQSVTIGIPCLNSERWLRAAIESALAQRDINPEVIVADDGSTDGSAGIARSFGEKVRLVPGTHRGGNAARNAALREATGEWIQFLDADDYLEPDKIATQLREGGNDADVLYSPVWIETLTRTPPSRDRSPTSPAADLPTQWIRWHIPQTGGALWRRDALLRIGGWKEDQPCCQEHELYLRAMKAGLRFAYAKTPGAVYRVWSEDTVSRKDPAKVVRVRTALLDEMLAWLGPRATPAHRTEIGRQCFEMARTIARFELPAAAAYHAERKARGLIRATGPAAPFHYRLAYHLLGFAAAERIAHGTR